jgi:hypothetical protein
MATEHERVKALFLAAIDRNDRVDRRTFLDNEIGDNPELRDRLDALMTAFDRPPGAVDRPLGRRGAWATPPARSSFSPGPAPP